MILFKDIADVQQYVGAANSITEVKLAPFERDAINHYIIPSLGLGMFNQLKAAYAASPGTAMGTDLANLLPYVQSATAKFMMLLWIPEGALNLSSSGISVTNTDKLKPASDVKVGQLTKKYLQAGYNDLELMLQFLEDNRGLMAYSSWKSSDNYTVFKQFFIQTANQFSEFVKISGRFTFLQLRGVMKSIQDFDIKKTLQDTIYNSIVDKLLAGSSLSDDETILMELIKPALANLAMSKALVQLAVVQDEKGLSLYSTNGTHDPEAWMPLDADSRKEMSCALKEEGGKYLRSLLDTLEAGNFDGYTKTVNISDIEPYENKADSGIYVF